MTNSPYSAAPPEKLDEIIREAEALLDAQLTLAISADQRALTYAGLLVTAIAALIGAASVTPDGILPPEGVFYVGVALLVAAALALWSARPTPWKTVGLEPSKWLEDIADGMDPLHNGRAALAGYYDNSIVENANQITWAGRAMSASMVITGVTLGLALAWLSCRVL